MGFSGPFSYHLPSKCIIIVIHSGDASLVITIIMLIINFIILQTLLPLTGGRISFLAFHQFRFNVSFQLKALMLLLCCNKMKPIFIRQEECFIS